MIKNVFLTEFGRMAKTGIAVFASAAALLLACGLISIGGAERALLCAKVAFGIGIALSYAVPLFFLAYTFWNERYSYFRVAGVKDKDVCGGRLLALFVSTVAFLAAEIILCTLFDALFFLGRAGLRNFLPQSWFMLSLCSHGAWRLLFAPSAAVTVCLVYYCYDAVKCAVKLQKTAWGRTVMAVVAIAVILAFQFLAVYFWQGSTYFDLNFLPFPDTALPLQFGAYRGIGDSVKDYHLFAAPILNLMFIVTEVLFVLACICFKKWIGRWRNEVAA